MRTFHENGPDYIPKMWDVVEIYIDGHREPFYGRVIQSSGNTAKGKISILCKSGPTAKSFFLIWKQNRKFWENNIVWKCWINGQNFTCEKVSKYDDSLSVELERLLKR
ncbi:MAG: hypothetical protein ACNFW9_03395 [Candidatus Kerfeldbacteria bacterium]